MKTTLNKLRAHSPCTSVWSKLLLNLGKTKADDEELAITTILESNGLDDALWCLRAVEGHDREIRLFAVECARSVQYLMTDPRSLNALDMAERFANGECTEQELYAAMAPAMAAARAVAWATAMASAMAAAWAAAMDTAWTAAWATARPAAMAAAWATARPAARPAAMAAAWAAQSNLLIFVCNGAFKDDTSNQIKNTSRLRR